MKRNGVTSKIIGITLVCLMLGAMFSGLPNIDNVEASSSYDRQAAYDYAEKYWDEVCSDGYFWWGNTDEQYVVLPLGTNVADPQRPGNDCAHFVSCCIGSEPNAHGGGLDVASDFPSGPYGKPSAQGLGNWLVNKGYGAEVYNGNGAGISIDDYLEMGDIVNYDWNGDGNWDHVAIYLGNGEVATHTECHWTPDETLDWHLGGADSYRFIHITTAAPTAIYVPDDYPTIQAAVDAASLGDTIIVRDGTYTENVDVNKDHLIIQSENGADSTIAQAANSDDHVFEVTADYVEITGFTVEEATGSDKAGIYLDNADHCEISNDMVLNSDYGIYLINSSYNNISNNTVKSCTKSGIMLNYSPTPGPYLPAVGHNIDEGDRPDYANPWEDEPWAYDGGTNTFAKSKVSHNRWTAWLELLPPTEKSLGIRFWIDSESQRSFFRVEILYSDYKSWDCLKNWNFPYSPAPKGEWVILDYPEGERAVERARVKFHAAGISGYKHVYLSEFQFKTVLDISCSNNDIVRNIVSDNGAGIRLSCASNNRIYLNNFINNTDNGYSKDSSNLWNSSEEITYTYSGNTYTNCLGNYWSDYAAYLPPVGHNNPGMIIRGNEFKWENESLAYDGNTDTFAKVWTFDDWSIGPLLELFAPPKQSQGIRFWLGPWVNYGIHPRIELFYEGDWHFLTEWREGKWRVLEEYREGPIPPKGEWIEIDYPEKMVEKAGIRYDSNVISSRGYAQLHEFQFKTTSSDADGDGIWDTPYSIDGDSDNYPLVQPFENYIKLMGKPAVIWKPADVNNYTVSDREKTYDIQYIVIHTTDASYTSAIYTFQNPGSGVSAHYVINKEGTEITQMVLDKDIAYHAGNWEYNTLSIGIEHEGYANDSNWVFSEEMYEKSASLVRWLCGQYNIPKDRNHIIGHNQVPHPSIPGKYGGKGGKVDPGIYWDWNYYMDLIRGTKGITLTTYSPVDILLTDPDGLTISKSVNEISGAVYIEVDVDGDGIPDDQINIAERKVGDYLITVTPELGALPGDTYTLEVSAEGTTIVLAENIQISDIPSEGYIVSSTETEIIQIIPATIDFEPDTLNLMSEGKFVTVYIELPPGFDVGQIDVSSITLNEVIPALTKPTEVGDYDGDGIPDLMVKFSRAAVQDLLQVGEQEVTITGKAAGVTFQGADTIRVLDK